MNSTCTESEFGALFAERFAARGLPKLYSQAPGPLIPEVEFKQGRPDFVCATYPTRRSSKHRAERIGAAISNSSTGKVLSHLKSKAGRSEEYLLAKTGLSAASMTETIKQLRSVDLVRTIGGTKNLAFSQNAPLAEICVFELKLTHWQRALFQAQQYRAAAHRVAIVMPADFIHRIERHAEKVSHFGVGIIALDTVAGSFKTIVHPRKSKPTSRQHYYHALGSYLRALATSDHAD